MHGRDQQMFNRSGNEALATQLLERFPNEISVRSICFRPHSKFTRTLILKNDRVYSVEAKKWEVPEWTIIRKRERGAKVSWYQLV